MTPKYLRKIGTDECFAYNPHLEARGDMTPWVGPLPWEKDKKVEGAIRPAAISTPAPGVDVTKLVEASSKKDEIITELKQRVEELNLIITDLSAQLAEATNTPDPLVNKTPETPETSAAKPAKKAAGKPGKTK